MQVLDLFNSKFEQDLKEGAVDQLEQRRIDDLNAKMKDLVARAREATTGAHKDALKREFDKVKSERDGYFKVKELDEKLKGLPGRTLGSARDVGKSVKKFRAQRGLDEGEMKRAMEADAERMSLEKFVAKYGDEAWIIEFWNDINGPLDESDRVVSQNVTPQQDVAQDEARSRKRKVLKDYAMLGRMRTEAAWALENNVYMNKEQILDYIEQKSHDPSLTALEYMHDLGHDVDGLFKNVSRFLTGAGVSPAKIQAIQNKIEKQMGEINEAGIGHDLVTPQQRVPRGQAKTDDALRAHYEKLRREKMAKSQPEKQTAVGKVADTAKQAAKWLAGKGGPGKEGPTYEGAEDIVDRGEYDREGDMAKDNLHTIRREAEELERILGDNDNLPEWVQDKLANVKGMITAVSEYMQTQYERDHEEATGEEGYTIAEGQKKNSKKVSEGRVQDLAAKVLLKKARASHPSANNDAEALAMYIADKESYDVARLDQVNDREDQAIEQLRDLETRLQQQIDDLKSAQGVEEGWSDAIVARRTGQPRTPYSIYIKGRKWKDFENEDHAENVANKLKAKFEREGKDPSVITIAPTDYDKGMDEAANPAQQAAIAIAMKKAHKKPKTDEAEDKPSLLDKAKDWLDTQQIKRYRKGRLPMPSGGRLANARAMFQKMAQDPKQDLGEADREVETTIRKLMAPAYEEETGGQFGYTLERKAPTMAALREKFHDDLNAILTQASPRVLARAAQELKDMYGQVAESKETVFRSHDIEVEYPEGKGHSHIYHRREPYRLSSIFSDANSVAARNRRAKISLFVDGEYVPNDVWQELDEAQTDFQKRRQRERDVDAGKPVSKQREPRTTDYQKRRAEQKRQDELGEEKTRLDPKCWKGKKIGNPKTKMKGGVRVNNCVPAESINEVDMGLDPDEFTGLPAHITSQRTVTSKNGVNDLTTRGSSVTGPTASGDYRVRVTQGPDKTGIASDVDNPQDVVGNPRGSNLAANYTTKTPPQGWMVDEQEREAPLTDPMNDPFQGLPSSVKTQSTLKQTNANYDYKDRTSSVTGPNTQGEYNVTVTQFPGDQTGIKSDADSPDEVTGQSGLASNYITKNPPKSWMQPQHIKMTKENFTAVMESQGITDPKLLEVARKIDLFAKSIK